MAETTDDRLRLHIEAVERLNAEKKAISEDISERYKLMKAEGYDCPTVRAIVRLRGMDEASRKEAEALLETYRCALGID